jgi:hypothetical protein
MVLPRPVFRVTRSGALQKRESDTRVCDMSNLTNRALIIKQSHRVQIASRKALAQSSVEVADNYLQLSSIAQP